MCPAQDHFIVLTLLIISMTFVLFLIWGKFVLCMFSVGMISMHTSVIHCSCKDVNIA